MVRLYEDTERRDAVEEEYRGPDEDVLVHTRIENPALGMSSLINKASAAS